ncbi:hypothetical protein XENTR_v10020834 [Xenopus tropicalis]|nr:hypothetical protein XENTR_v10020834 [Xenopus tropicalis]
MLRFPKTDAVRSVHSAALYNRHLVNDPSKADVPYLWAGPLSGGERGFFYAGPSPVRKVTQIAYATVTTKGGTWIYCKPHRYQCSGET